MIEYRKANATGLKGGSVTLTLPISWVREQGIEKGQLLKVAIMGDKLVIMKAKMEE